MSGACGPSAGLARELALGRARVVLASREEVLEACGDAEPYEPLGGVPVRARDGRERAAGAHAAGRLLVADNARATLALSAPCLRGADVHLELLDAVPAGEGLALVGLSRELSADPPAALAALLDDAPAPGAERLAAVASGLGDLAASVRAASDAARVAAEYLRCHPAVAEARYPGLACDPCNAEARRALHHGFGPLVDVRLARDPGSDADLGPLAPAGGGWRRLACRPGDALALVGELEGALAPLAS